MQAESSLRLHRFLMRFAFAGANLFAWIFVFQYFAIFHPVHDALARVSLLYALVSVVSILVTPYAALRLRHGMKTGIMYGVLCATLAFVALALSFRGFFGYQYVDGIVLFAILLGAYRAFYWVPYSVEVQEIRPYTITSPFVEILVALAPALLGVLLVQRILVPAEALFVGGVLIAASLAPLFFVPDVYERFSWHYKETFAELFSRKHRLTLLRCIVDGIQSAALFFLWPIAIFLIVGLSYSLLGGVISITLLLALLLRKPVRALLRMWQVKDASLLHATVAISAWIGRVLVASPVTIVIVDTYFHTGTAGRPGADALALDQIADGGHFVDEYTALKEMGLGIGRAAICIFAALVAMVFSISISLLATFIVAALAAGISVWLMHLAASEERI